MANSAGKSTSEPFLCGVVEGFYGRPWTTEQRRELYRRIGALGMNTYVYAPKDDLKHRANWRDKYTPEEADHLQNLIEASHSNKVTFVYALSPGIDIVYSSVKDVTAIKHKLDQVWRLGCRSFALLFDDIDPTIAEADKSKFSSLAHAQLSVANEVYEHLNLPLFFFCPTEYCESRALPSLEQSEYLDVLGRKLMTGIHILWTGPRVISRLITSAHIRRVSSVFRRAPVIWDNLHANDYDARRLFLGPYSGRPVALKPLIAGVLINPNCEFEANYTAFATLAHWSRCDGEADVEEETDAILEAGGIEPVAASITSAAKPTELYHPLKALNEALKTWMALVLLSRNGLTPPGRPQEPTDPPPEGTLPVYTPVDVAQSLMDPLAPPTLLTNESTVVVENPSLPLQQPVNSLLSDYTQMNYCCEPMDLEQPKEVEGEREDGMQVDKEDPSTMSNELLQLLADLFYLPFEHGIKGKLLLSEFRWLTDNAHVIKQAQHSGNRVQCDEWLRRSDSFCSLCRLVTELYFRLLGCPNRTLVTEFYPYLWEMQLIVSLLCTFVQWVACGYLQQRLNANDSCNDSYTEDNVLVSETCSQASVNSTEEEPWVWRGGLISDLQKLLMDDSIARDLFPIRPANPPPLRTISVRPAVIADKKAMYELALNTFDDGGDASERFLQFPDLVGDRCVGTFLEFSLDYCFVAEIESFGDRQMVGFVLGAEDAMLFLEKCYKYYVPEMKNKYKQIINSDNDSDISDESIIITPEELISSFYTWNPRCPVSLSERYPSLMHLRCAPRFLDTSVRTRLAIAIIAAFRANRCPGVYSEVRRCEKRMAEMYSHLGFFELSPIEESNSDICLVGRTIDVIAHKISVPKPPMPDIQESCVTEIMAD